MSALERGSRIGEYTLVARHWDGALGDVWIARRAGSRRKPKLYALRIVPAPDAETTTRLISWGCAMGHVDEPSIARAVDLVTNGEHTAVISELAIGESLHQVCRVVRGWSPSLALSAVLVLARTLQRVRDLRDHGGEPLPQLGGRFDADHVVVDYERQRLAVLDLGLAAALDEDAQAPGDEVLSLGRLLWEMLTGRAPPPAARPTRLPAVRGLGVKTTKAVDKLIRTATAPDPALRYGSVVAFIADLERALDEHKRIDVPQELGRILRQRLQHRVQAMRTLVQRWSDAPAAPARKPSRASPPPAPTPAACEDVMDLPILDPVEAPPSLHFGGVQALPLVEPLPLSVGLPKAAADTDEMPARTRDLSATGDLATPQASVLQTFRQLTWLGGLVLVGLAASAYLGTDSGAHALDVLVRLLGG